MARKIEIYKNLASLTCSFLLIFSAYLALMSLQSSLNQDKSKGLIALSLLYAGYFFSVIYSPFAVDKLGTKGTLLLSFVTHTVFIISNFYPKFWILLPASLLLGLVVAPQFTAQSVVISRLAIQYSQLTKSDLDVTMTRFNGVTSSVMYLSGIPGSLVSSSLLSKTANDSDFAKISENVTMDSENYFVELQTCGSYYCPSDILESNSNTNATESANVDSVSLYIVLSIYLAINLSGVLVTAVFMKNIQPTENETHRKHTLKNLVGLFKDSYIPGILFLTVLNASTNSFSVAIFTNSFITCSLGISMVGYGYMCYALGRSTGGALSGFGQRHIPRGFHFLLAFALLGGLLTICLLCVPTSLHIAVLYLMFFGYGFSFGILDIQLKSIIALIFPHNLSPAFSLRCLADGVGHAASFAYMGILCTRTIIYLQFAIWIGGIAAYVFIHVKMHQQAKKKKSHLQEAKHGEERCSLHELK